LREIISIRALEEAACMRGFAGLAIILYGPQTMPERSGLVFRKI
jgi:hypothetical protein